MPFSCANASARQTCRSTRSCASESAEPASTLAQLLPSMRFMTTATASPCRASVCTDATLGCARAAPTHASLSNAARTTALEVA